MENYTGVYSDSGNNGWWKGGIDNMYTSAVQYHNSIQYDRFAEDQRRIQQAGLDGVNNAAASASHSDMARRMYNRQAEMDRTSHIGGTTMAVADLVTYEASSLALSGAGAALGTAIGGPIGGFVGGFALPMVANTAIGAPIKRGMESHIQDQMRFQQTAMDFDLYGTQLGFGSMSYSDANAASYQMQNMFSSAGGGFFDRNDTERIHKMAMSNGMISATGGSSLDTSSGSMERYKNNFKELVSTTEEVVKLLNTTIEGGMSVMKELSESGIQMGQMKAYVTNVKSASAATGLSTQNVMSLGAAGAQAVQSTGIRGDIGASMYIHNAATAGDIAASSTYGADVVSRVGGEARAGAMLANAEFNTFKSGWGTKMAFYAMDSDGKMNTAKLDAMLSGKVSTDQIVAGADTNADRMGINGRAMAWKYKEDWYNNLNDEKRDKLFKVGFDKWAENHEGSREALLSTYAGNIAGDDTKYRRLIIEKLNHSTAFSSANAAENMTGLLSTYRADKVTDEKDRETRSDNWIPVLKDVFREFGERIEKGSKDLAAQVERNVTAKDNGSVIASALGLNDEWKAYKSDGGFWGSVGRGLNLTNEYKSHQDTIAMNAEAMLKLFTGVNRTQGAVRGNEILTNARNNGTVSDFEGMDPELNQEAYEDFYSNTQFGNMSFSKRAELVRKAKMVVAHGGTMRDLFGGESGGEFTQMLGLKRGMFRGDPYYKKLATMNANESAVLLNTISSNFDGLNTEAVRNLGEMNTAIEERGFNLTSKENNFYGDEIVKLAENMIGKDYYGYDANGNLVNRGTLQRSDINAMADAGEFGELAQAAFMTPKVVNGVLKGVGNAQFTTVGGRFGHLNMFNTDASGRLSSSSKQGMFLRRGHLRTVANETGSTLALPNITTIQDAYSNFISKVGDATIGYQPNGVNNGIKTLKMSDILTRESEFGFNVTDAEGFQGFLSGYNDYLAYDNSNLTKEQIAGYDQYTRMISMGSVSGSPATDVGAAATLVARGYDRAYVSQELAFRRGRLNQVRTDHEEEFGGASAAAKTAYSNIEKYLMGDSSINMSSLGSYIDTSKDLLKNIGVVMGTYTPGDLTGSALDQYNAGFARKNLIGDNPELQTREARAAIYDRLGSLNDILGMSGSSGSGRYTVPLSLDAIRQKAENAGIDKALLDDISTPEGVKALVRRERDNLRDERDRLEASAGIDGTVNNTSNERNVTSRPMVQSFWNNQWGKR